MKLIKVTTENHTYVAVFPSGTTKKEIRKKFETKIISYFKRIGLDKEDAESHLSCI